MFNSSKNILKARCDSLSVVLKLLFWVYAIYLIIFLGTGLWLMFQPSGDFGIRLLDTGNGIAGYGFFKGGLEVDFARDLLNGKSMESPKNVYLAGYFCGFAVKAITLAILWNIKNIFKRIDEDHSPFMNQCCKSIFSIGVLVIISAFVKSAFVPTALGITGYLESACATSAGFWYSMIIGGIIISLSYICEYGTSLQIESDETL